jgi:predicted RND superfamily exporter protein
MRISKWIFIPIFIAILTVGVVNIFLDYPNNWVGYDISCILIGLVGLGIIVTFSYLEKKNANKAKV